MKLERKIIVTFLSQSLWTIIGKHAINASVVDLCPDWRNPCTQSRLVKLCGEYVR